MRGAPRGGARAASRAHRDVAPALVRGGAGAARVGNHEVLLMPKPAELERHVGRRRQPGTAAGLNTRSPAVHNIHIDRCKFCIDIFSYHKIISKWFDDKFNHDDVQVSVRKTNLGANHTILPKLQV